MSVRVAGDADTGMAKHGADFLGARAARQQANHSATLSPKLGLDGCSARFARTRLGEASQPAHSIDRGQTWS